MERNAVSTTISVALTAAFAATQEQRGGSYDLGTSAGNGVFCADPNLAHVQMYGD